MNQQDSKRKFNPDNIPSKGDDKKKPKFNIYWVYGIIFLTIIAWNFMRTVNSAGIETDQQKFFNRFGFGDELYEFSANDGKLWGRYQYGFYIDHSRYL